MHTKANNSQISQWSLINKSEAYKMYKRVMPPPHHSSSGGTCPSFPLLPSSMGCYTIVQSLCSNISCPKPHQATEQATSTEKNLLISQSIILCDKTLSRCMTIKWLWFLASPFARLPRVCDENKPCPSINLPHWDLYSPVERSLASQPHQPTRLDGMCNLLPSILILHAMSEGPPRLTIA